MPGDRRGLERQDAMVNAWTAGIVEVSGGYLAYHRTGGEGPPLVLSHGLTDNGLCWRRLALALQENFDIIMLDARGHGASSRIRPGAWDDPGADIAQVIDQLSLENPIVMGHSVGARATADYAAAFPGRVGKVILEDPPFLPIAPPSATTKRRARFRQQVLGYASLTELAIIDMGKRASPFWCDDDFPDWAAAKKQVDPEAMPVYAHPWQDSIRAITAPTLLIHGEASCGSLITAELAAQAQAINPKIATVQISGAGHNVRRENFSGYLAAVRAFL